MDSLDRGSDQDAGQQIGLSDVTRILNERKLLIAGFLLGAILLGGAVSYVMPEKFEASTVFLLKERSFLAQLYGPAFIQIPFKNNLANIRDDVLSYANLDQVGRALGLKGQVNNEREWDEFIVQMRDNINIDVRSQKFADDVITLSFTDGDSYRVYQVVNRLRDAYIESNVAGYQEEIRKLMDRYRATNRTTENQRASLRQNLSRFMQAHQTEVGGGATRNVVQLDQKEKRRDELLTQIVTLEENEQALKEDFAKETPKVKETVKDRNPDYETLRVEGLTLRREIKLMEKHYTDLHPKLIESREKFERIEAELRQTEPLIDTREIIKDNERYYKLRSQLRETQKKLQLKRSQQSNLETDIAVLNNNMRALPGLLDRKRDMEDRLIQLGSQLTQGQAQLRRMEDLWERSKEAGGTVYEIKEQARRPRSPSWPNRPLILGVAIGLGLGLSLALSYLLEMSRQTFGSVAEASARLGVPVMGAIEMIVGPEEILRRRRRRVMAVVMASFVLLVGAAFTFVYWRFPEALPETVLDLLEKL